jgi:hypothetical protein
MAQTDGCYPQPGQTASATEKRSGSGADEQREPELVLEVTMVMNMFVVVVMMYIGGERRACKHHRKQSEND